MRQIISVSPFRCRLWDLHDRLETEVSEETCRAEIESFTKHGQLVPVLGRALRGEALYDFELIYGARRLFVARQLNKPLLVEIRDLSDREAIIAMDIENRQRRDISPYERGMAYARWLREKRFASQDEIAQALKVSASQVSRLLKIARLPTVVVDAFARPAEICEGWGLEIAEALDNQDRRPVVIQRARAIGRQLPRPSAAEVYRRLLSTDCRAAHRRPGRDEIVRDASGQPIFRVRFQRSFVAILLPKETSGTNTLPMVCAAISSVLREESAAVKSAPTLDAQQAES